MSSKNQTPSTDAATPRTAEDTICVIGDVTLMDSRLAMLIKKPRTPYSKHGLRFQITWTERIRTVTADPHMKAVKGLISPSSTIGLLKSSSCTPGPSPVKSNRGSRMRALTKLVYQERWRALPLTTSKLLLITTECMAVIMELATPKEIPTSETGVPSRKTPMKKPEVTKEHARSTKSEGREWRKTYEVQTVKGNTMPRATW